MMQRRLPDPAPNVRRPDSARETINFDSVPAGY